jgi:hypothetical protein
MKDKVEPSKGKAYQYLANASNFVGEASQSGLGF